MSKGQDHVAAALAVCQSFLEQLGDSARLPQEARAEALARLQASQGTLEEVSDRFFLRTKLCLPFAARCEEGARGVAEALEALAAQPDEGAEARFAEALATFEKAIAVLEERSAMRGMAIT